MTAEAALSVGPAQPGPPGDRRARLVTALITRARAGDSQAWDALVERYSPLIWSICRRYRLTAGDAEDAAQNVWLKLLDHLDDLRTPAAVPGWLATTTRRECLRILRTQPPLAAGYVLDDETRPDEQSATPEQEVLTAERQAALLEAFAELPPDGQRLITLLLAGVPYTQISRQLGLPIGSIGQARRRYLDKLRRHPAVGALTDIGRPG
jgi:RNA polymerase sigma factor (sigma-70 family)